MSWGLPFICWSPIERNRHYNSCLLWLNIDEILHTCVYSKYSYYWLLYMIMDGNGQYQASYCKNINVISNIWRKMTALGMADFGATPHVWTSHGGAEETPWQSWWHWSMVSGQDMWSSSHSAETLEEKGWDGGKYQCLMENDGNWMIDITFNDIGDYWLSPCIPHAPKYIYI
jgi:hypothetical protein